MTLVEQKPVKTLSVKAIPCALIAGGTLFFIAVAADIHFNGLLAQADRFIAPYLYERQSPPVVFIASCVSGLGQLWTAVGGTIAACIFMWRKHLFREMAVWIGGISGCGLVCDTLKGLFKVPRPSRFVSFVWDPLREGYSFPSGHTMSVMVMSGLLVLLLMRLKPRPRATRIAFALAVLGMGVMEATALLYVGVHYLTDLLGGLGVATAWLGVLLWLLPPLPSQAKDAPA